MPNVRSRHLHVWQTCKRRGQQQKHVCNNNRNKKFAQQQKQLQLQQQQKQTFAQQQKQLQLQQQQKQTFAQQQKQSQLAVEQRLHNNRNCCRLQEQRKHFPQQQQRGDKQQPTSGAQAAQHACAIRGRRPPGAARTPRGRIVPPRHPAPPHTGCVRLGRTGRARWAWVRAVPGLGARRSAPAGGRRPGAPGARRTHANRCN